MNNETKSDTPETEEAWKAVSRTPDGMFDSRVPISAFAYAMADHSKKMERERDSLREALSACMEDSIELLGEREWWKDESRSGYAERYAQTVENIREAQALLATPKNKLK